MRRTLPRPNTPIDKIVTIQKFDFDGKLKILRSYSGSGFQVNDEFIRRTGFNGYLMHPGPMNIDAEITKKVAEADNSLILNQVENGLYLRAALLSLIA